ncbi:MAG: hypothetical protein WBD20_26295 [Pirellulaceae bacterium]
MVGIGRWLLLVSYALYWGGLTFYTGFVVRIIHDVVNDPMDGGMITQRVTVLLQFFGVVTTVLMLANAFQVGRSNKRHGCMLGLCAAALGVSIVGLLIVHSNLDAVIDIKAAQVTDRDVFTLNHRRYNQLTTVQWIASLIYLPITIVAWQREANG